ncbi:MAG: 7-cyano-7-deazaguanine synthase [bacterium]
MQKREVSLFFSGGTDSTATSILALNNYDKVHLLTFDRGIKYGMGQVDKTCKRAEDLIQKYGKDRFTHSVIYIGDIFREIFIDNFAHDLKIYKTHLMALVCLACRIAMHAKAILYNLKNKVPDIIDGSNQEQAFEQMPELLREYALFDGEFGINYTNPIFCFSDKDKRQEILYEAGLSKNRKFKYALFGGTSDGIIFHPTQPACIFSPFMGAYGRYLYHLFEDTTEEKERRIAVEYCRKKKEIARKFVNFSLSTLNL